MFNGVGLLQVVLDFSETVPSHVFLACLRAVLARHGLISTTPGQVSPGPPSRTDDWTCLTHDEAERRFAVLLQSDRFAAFDPAEALPMRVRVFSLPARGSKVLISYHRMLTDGIGRDKLLAELISCYDAARANRPYLPPKLRAGTDMMVEDPEAMLAFWRKALHGLASHRSLDHRAIDHGARTAPTAASRQATHHLSLPPDLRTRLQSRAVAMKASLATMIYAAWALCLHRLDREYDVAFLTIRNLRTVAGLGRGAAVRSLVNTVPLRITVDRTQMLADFVRTLSEFWDMSRPHIAAELPRIHALCGLHDHDWKTSILVQRDRFTSWFADSAPRGGQRRVRVHDYSNVPLTVSFTYGNGLNIDLQYWTDAFPPERVATIAESLTALLAGMADNPHRTLGELPYLSREQQDLIEHAAEGPRDPDAKGRLLHADFEAWAARHPEAVALTSDTKSVTYGELDAAANALAAHLVEIGVAPEEPIAVFNERDPGYLISVLAVLKAGAAFLPVAAGYPDLEIRQILAAAGARFCLCPPSLADRFTGTQVTAVTLDDERLLAHAARPFCRSSDPRRLAYLIATSGTTGTPKIVEVAHEAAANTICHSVKRIYAAGDLAVVPWTDASTTDASIHQIFAPLTRGGRLIQVANIGRLKSHPCFASFTTFGATPSVLSSLLEDKAIPPALSALMFGGEQCPPGLPARLRAASTLSRAVNVYGPTEAAIYCTADDVMAPRDSIRYSIGRPIANMRIDVLDDHLQSTIPGTVGEICISGVGLARGYRSRPDLTAAAFPIVRGADGHNRRVYRSGDLGAFLPDGRLAFFGRRDRQVKIRGVRIELEAVEYELGTLPGVQQAVVNVMSIADGEHHLVGWVTTESVCSPAALLNELRAKLPAPMIPESLTIVDHIPLTPNGKPDLFALPGPAVAPAVLTPRWNGPESDDDTEGVADPELIGLIANTLAVSASSITKSSTIHNTWGWNSLRHIMLILRLEEAYGIEVTDDEIAAAISVSAIIDLLHNKKQMSRAAGP
jgi:glycopeptidolipid biosynthesis protein